MKKKILFGAIFSICIIILVNTSSAVEYKSVTDNNINLLKSKLQNIDIFIEKIREKIENLNVKSIDLKSTNSLQKLSNKLSKLRISYLNNPSISMIFDNLKGLILCIILSIIGTILGIIFGKIFGHLIVLIVKILTAPAILLAKIIEFIVKLLIP